MSAFAIQSLNSPPNGKLQCCGPDVDVSVNIKVDVGVGSSGGFSVSVGVGVSGCVNDPFF
jgi:hypothetical protein